MSEHEGEPVAYDAGVGSYDYVAQKVNSLQVLVDGFLDTTHAALLRARDNQDSRRWTDLPGCDDFRLQYTMSIDRADIKLRAVWDEILVFAQNLQTAMQSLDNQDSEVAAQLDAVIRRLEGERPSEYAEFRRIDLGPSVTGLPSIVVPGAGGYDLDGYVPGSGELPDTTSADGARQGTADDGMSGTVRG